MVFGPAVDLLVSPLPAEAFDFTDGHSGLDPWFDRLTTLSTVEGESSCFSGC